MLTILELVWFCKISFFLEDKHDFKVFIPCKVNHKLKHLVCEDYLANMICLLLFVCFCVIMAQNRK